MAGPEDSIRLEGRRVILRTLRAEEVGALLEAQRSLEAWIQPEGPPSEERMRLRVARSGRLDEGRLDLGIEAEGELIGAIQTYRPPGRNLPPDAYELGVVIYEPAHRGRGLGTEAVALLTEWLISEAGARRVQADGPLRLGNGLEALATEVAIERKRLLDCQFAHDLETNPVDERAASADRGEIRGYCGSVESLIHEQEADLRHHVLEEVSGG